MRMPAMKVSQSATGNHRVNTQKKERSSQPFRTPRESQKLLIVDQERSIRHILAHYLTRCGHVCMEVADGNQAIGLLRRKIFNGVIADLHMPGMSGPDLIRTIRNQDAGLAIVVLSAHPGPGDALWALKLGADDYIPKPIDLADVSTCLDRALARRDLRLQIHDTQAALENTARGRSPQVQRMLLPFTQCLVTAHESNAPCPDGPSPRVAWLSAQVTKAESLDNDELEILRLEAMSHDLGGFLSNHSETRH
jgi:DNA-binding response OmpR family regulator